MPHRVRVADAFDAYRLAVLPRSASDTQLLECQRAFYAGAYALLTDVLLGIGDLSDDDAVAQLEAVKAECEAFGKAGGFPVPPPPDASITVPDVHHTAPNAATIKPLLERLGQSIGGMLPPGLVFTLFLYELGPDGSLFYISSADRADVLTALKDFIRRQVQ